MRGVSRKAMGTVAIAASAANPEVEDYESERREVVPGLVEIEVAVPHLRLAEW